MHLVLDLTSVPYDTVQATTRSRTAVVLALGNTTLILARPHAERLCELLRAQLEDLSRTTVPEGEPVGYEAALPQEAAL